MGIFDFLKKNKNIENDYGLNEIYYDNGRGTIQKRFYMKNGIYDGLFNEWYENGQLKWDVNYKLGNMVSPSKEYYDNGNIKMEGSWKEGSNIPHGTTKAFYRNRGLKGVSTNKDGMQHGLHQEYFELIAGVSALEIEGQYKDGGKDGIWKVYYDSGKLQEEQVWKDGKKNGYFKAFAKDGQTLELEGNYKNDIQHGPQKSWHENGQIEFDCSFHYGETDGIFRQFDEKGQLLKEANFKNGNEIINK